MGLCDCTYGHLQGPSQGQRTCIVRARVRVRVTVTVTVTVKRYLIVPHDDVHWPLEAPGGLAEEC